MLIFLFCIKYFILCITIVIYNFCFNSIQLIIFTGSLDFLHLPWISCYSSPIVYDFKDWRSWNHYKPLSIPSWHVPCIVYCQLGLSLLLWRILWFYCYRCWLCANCPLLWFLLSIYYKRWSKNTIYIRSVWMRMFSNMEKKISVFENNKAQVLLKL